MRRHDTNVTALLSGLLFIGIGVYALAIGADRLDDELRWVWPVTLLGLGSALLAGTSASEHRARHQIGAEGSEDGEVEQPGRSHDG
jgi:hypothetical protein